MEPTKEEKDTLQLLKAMRIMFFSTPSPLSEEEQEKRLLFMIRLYYEEAKKLEGFTEATKIIVSLIQKINDRFSKEYKV